MLSSQENTCVHRNALNQANPVDLMMHPHGHLQMLRNVVVLLYYMQNDVSNSISMVIGDKMRDLI